MTLCALHNAIVRTSQGIINRTGMETRQIFSRTLVIAKIKEWFAPFLGGITARVICVFSTTVAVKTKWLDWLRRTRTKKDDGRRVNPKRVTFLA